MTCIVPNCQQQKITNEKLSMHLFPDPSREPTRHLKWVKLINAERIFKYEPAAVFKRFRVCRNHFDSSCFNGDCKKLLTTAIPSLHLDIDNNQNRLKSKYLQYEEKVVSILKKNSVDVEEDSLRLIDISDKIQPNNLLKDEHELKISFKDKLWPCEEDEETGEAEVEEEFLLMEVVNDCPDNQSQSQYTILMPPPQETINIVPAKVLNYNQKLSSKSVAISIPASNNLKSKIISSQNSSLLPLSKTTLKSLQTNFYKCPKKMMAQNICTKMDLLEVFSSRYGVSEDNFINKIDLQTKEVDKQYWCHSSFVAMRLPFMKQWNIEEFEFSQAYFFYWDKIERSYYFLNNIIETAKRGESVEGRLVSFLLHDPIGDGGQWDMIVSIINKHGVMPKKCFPETFSSEASGRMNTILKSKLREYSKVLRDLIASGASSEVIQSKVDEQMGEIYNIVGICLGIPPETFTWEYYDKNKKYFSVGPLTAVEFYEKYVKPYFNVDDKVCLVTDPRPSNEFGKGYTVDCLGNVVGGRPVFYNNQPVDVLIDAASKSISNKETVLVSCNLSRLYNFEMKNFKLLSDVEIISNLNKTDQIKFKDTSMKYGMILTGSSPIDKNGLNLKFLIEDFSNIKQNAKKCFIIPRESFSDIISEIIIDKKYLSNSVMKVFDVEPKVLDVFDPLSEFVL